MQQVNLHKVKLFALLEAGIALIGMFLNWAVVNIPAAAQQQQLNNFNGLQNQIGGLTQQGAATVQQTQNGFGGWGFLSLIGIIGVVAVVLFIGDKTKDFDKNTKNLAIACFLAIAAGALIYFITENSEGKKYAAVFQQRGITYSFGIGLWSTLAAGAIGVLWVGGVLAKLGTPQGTPGLVITPAQPSNTTPPPTTPTA